MKYFCQDFKDIPIIVTGSMVRMKIQRENKKRGKKNQDHFLFPIGKINQLTIFPLNFEEYLLNRNKQLYNIILSSFNHKSACDELIHNKALEIFYEYLLLGGMPEVVDIFLKTNNYQISRETIKDLYDNYLQDMDLYQASSESIIRTKSIFESLFSQLNKESKNFKASLIEKNIKNRDLRSPLDWLIFTHIIYKSSLIKENITIPLINSEEALFRLYLSDIGLFSYQSKISPTTFIDKTTRNTLSGVFFENYIALELVRAGYKLFYWKGKGDSELEFIIEYNSSIIPIDVKKTSGTIFSINKFKNHNKFLLAIKFSENNFGYDKNNKILTIPFYYVPFLFNALKNGELNKLIDD